MPVKPFSWPGAEKSAFGADFSGKAAADRPGIQCGADPCDFTGERWTGHPVSGPAVEGGKDALPPLIKRAGEGEFEGDPLSRQ